MDEKGIMEGGERTQEEGEERREGVGGGGGEKSWGFWAGI